MSASDPQAAAGREALHALLDRGAAFDAEYGASLSTHRPMALVALWRLGATPARLEAFAAQYERRLQPMPPAEPWPPGDPWPDRLGDPRAWPLYRHLFAQWLAHEGADMLPQALPRLLQGAGAAAFHGLIRTAYAIEAAHPAELADALAYWACRWLDLGGAVASTASGASATADPAALLAGLRPAPAASGLVVHRMQAAAGSRGFDRAVAALRIDAGSTLPRLARLAARLHARSGDFMALHLVTSAQALRVLLPHIDPDDVPAALAAYWRAYAAGVVAAALPPGRAPVARPWDELVAAALASDDEHLVKLVDAAREEQRHHGGADDWQRAATRAVLPEGAPTASRRGARHTPSNGRPLNAP